MKCPHCSVGIHEEFSNYQLIVEPEIFRQGGQCVAPGAVWSARYQRCPECHESIIYLEKILVGSRVIKHDFMAYPSGPSRSVPPDVSDPYRQDFVEAVRVLPYSPKASAALSRRCLQAVLRDRAGTKSKDLYDQIEEVANTGNVPTYITNDLHAVRSIGNIAAHSVKSTSTGSIVDVEPGEAEWNLDVLELLFDFYFVQPAISARRKAGLNLKLKEAGKPELK